ncbi:F3H9.20 PROTEIN [Salix koriyanagi]|uniref:F3H9.20 PROTEIN n=1 Tax=Salix koriyanagi TaxID=2511006 RepID=A0A9Q0T607_9ROSI|nr:F3H9.20 PROTEIN [Salix koriyanagi]
MASRVLSTCLITPPTKFTHAPIVKFSNKASWFRSKNGRIKCGAVGDSSQPVYNGVYGPWTVESSDVREVILYRSGLVTAASSFVLAASYAFLPSDSQLSEIIKQNLDLLYTLGAGGLGLSLFLIHIYVTEIKRTLQAFWALGAIGSLVTCTNLAQPAGENLIQYVVDNPIAVWFVGPLFAALTGLVFKEGLCYGKLEAGILTFIIPTVLLGHLTGLMDDGVKLTLLASWMTLFVIFAGRKFTQPIKDDIGDKSVFMFNSLPDDEKKALIKKLEQQ